MQAATLDRCSPVAQGVILRQIRAGGLTFERGLELHVRAGIPASRVLTDATRS